MQRIYLPSAEYTDVLEIQEKILYHQLTRVLRGRVGQQVAFFNGVDLIDVIYEMVHIDKNSVSFKKKDSIQKNNEVSQGMTLYQSMPNKLSKLETIIQKCSEVGYQSIVFFDSERSQKFMLSDNKKERLKKIAIEATEQCGGNIIPEISYIDGIDSIKCHNLYLCHTEESNSLRLDDILIGEELGIMVGPEGGFSDSEIERLTKKEVKKIFLGNRILRLETVGENIGFFLTQKKES